MSRSTRPLIHPRDEIIHAMERIYRYRMTTTSGGNLSIRDEHGDVWITPAADAGGFATTAAVVDHRQRQQSACLICVPRIPRQLTKLRSREVRAECYR